MSQCQIIIEMVIEKHILLGRDPRIRMDVQSVQTGVLEQRVQCHVHSHVMRHHSVMIKSIVVTDNVVKQGHDLIVVPGNGDCCGVGIVGKQTVFDKSPQPDHWTAGSRTDIQTAPVVSHGIGAEQEEYGIVEMELNSLG